MKFGAFLGNYKRAILFLMAAFAIGGLIATLTLPLSLFPKVAFPRVRIELNSGVRPAHQMVLLVTKPAERALRAIPHVVSVRSETSRGSAQIYVNFGWGTPMVAATSQVNAAMSQTTPTMPPGTTYTVRRMDPTVFPIIAYAMTSPTVSQSKLRTIARYQIVPLLTGIKGVARVAVNGGDTPEVHVLIDPRRMLAKHVTLAEVRQAIARANVLSVVGRVQDQDLLYLLVQNNTVASLDQVRNIVVHSGPDGITRLDEVATVTMGTVPKYVSVAEDGKAATMVLVYQQPNGNAVAVAKAVKQKLAGFKPSLPPDVTLTKWYDQSALVTATAGSVRDAIGIGVILAGVILISFLRSWRVTLVALLMVPAAMSTAVLVLSVMGMSFNIMTLGGLAASVGLVIDDAIVMIEHLARRAGEAKAGEKQGRVLSASSEFLPPLSGSSLATLIVFTPLSFLSGLFGAFFSALSITMAATLIVSWLLSAFAVPVLARSLINFDKWEDPQSRKDGRMLRTQQSLLRRLFARPAWLLLGIVPLLLIAYFSFTRVTTGFLPRLDQGGFVLDYRTQPGTSLAESVREVKQIGDILTADPAVQTYSRRTGAGLGGTLSTTSEGDFFVLLKPLGQRKLIWPIMQRISDQIKAKVPGVTFDYSQLMGDLLGDLTGLPQPIVISLSGGASQELLETARNVAKGISGIKGVRSVHNGIVVAGNSLDIEVDPARAAMVGVDPTAVENQINTAIAGSVVTKLPEQQRFLGVRVTLPEGYSRYRYDLANIPVETRSGALVPLGDIASFHVVTGQPEIDRNNLTRVDDVTGRITGRGFSATIRDVKHKVLDKPSMLPPGIHYTLGGLYKQLRLAFQGVIRVFMLALIGEVALLLFLYRSFRIAIAVLATSLMSASAVFIGLMLAGVALNITALMGMTMILGLSTETAIFYVSEFLELRAAQPLGEALIAASRNRLRPIAMSTFAAVLTLMPLALDIGQGAGMQQPLAIAVISGFLVQFPLSLLALPVMLNLLLRDHHFTEWLPARVRGWIGA
ncbi:MAG: transporter [Rhodospirillales bacterium 20-64-7]|nr:MAG: transporter [Rhodospirillales bacterium 20-64-7]